MDKKSLVIFIGKPGMGKTTLIQSAFPDWQYFDIKPYISKYMISGKWLENKTLTGYQEMYDDMNKADNNLVLEIGTNHPEFNTKKISDLGTKFQIKIVVCVLDKEINKQRYFHRGLINNKEVFDQDSFFKRLDHKFPETHLPLISGHKLPHIILDTAPSIAKLTAILKRAFDGYINIC